MMDVTTFDLLNHNPKVILHETRHLHNFAMQMHQTAVKYNKLI